MKDVLKEVRQRKQNFIIQDRQQTSDPGLKTIFPSTADAIIRKVQRTLPNMPWLDAIGNEVKTMKPTAGTLFPNAFDRERIDFNLVTPLHIDKLIQRGGIVHIDCSNLDPRTYALFLSRFLYLNQKHLTNDRSHGVVEFVDEAHRLFTNGSRYSDMLGSTFSLTMVEGRSQGHGVILSLQNASQVPSMLLNNINSHIVMRQNNRMVAKAATQTMDDEYADHSITLSSGEALCQMFESSATVLVRMAPSPFELERSDNAGN